MTKIDFKNNQSAFTLMETIVALLIMIIGLLSVAQLFIASTYSNKYAQNITTAAKAAEDMIERLRAINDWSDPRIMPGGTVRMVSDGGPVINTMSDPGAKYVAGVRFEPVLQGSRQRNLAMKLIEPGDAGWAKRSFEIRWQVIGYNSSGLVAPTGVYLNHAYNPNPNFSTLSSPTQPRPDGQQSAVWVILRIAPTTDRAKVAKRIQIATLFVNPK